MRKNKKQKIMVIVALTISVLGLTLGFAAFSNTLTISSSATVKPDSSDFNVGVYGFQYDGEYQGDSWDVSFYTSSTSSKPYSWEGTVASPAKISDNGKSITISDISVEMSEPNEGAEYYFMIKNDGQYDAYFDFDAMNVSIDKTCTPGVGATETLVEGACEAISSYVAANVLEKQPNGEYWDISSDAFNSGGKFALTKERYIMLQLAIFYDNYPNGHNSPPAIRADGPFTIDIAEVTLDFTSV